jgi:hypothetical protein
MQIIAVLLFAVVAASAAPPPLPDHLAADAAAIIALSCNFSSSHVLCNFKFKFD